MCWVAYVNFTFKLFLEVWDVCKFKSIVWNFMKALSGCLKAKKIKNIVIATIEFMLGNTE